MMAFDFKRMVEFDRRSVFLNLDEFGEMHRVEGKTITAVFDDDALQQRKGGQALGIAESNLMLFAASEDLPKHRPAGECLNIDGREYIIADWGEDMGMSTVTLEQSVTM